MIKNETLELQAKIYLFDLKNCALENGFKTGEDWEVSRVTQAEKIELEKRYYPTISAKVFPETLTALFGLVKSNLNSAQATNPKNELDEIPDHNLEYLFAFSLNRLRN